MSFIGVTYWNMGDFQEQKWLIKFTLALVTANKDGNPQHSAQPAGSSTESVLSKWFGWWRLLPGSSADSCFFQSNWSGLSIFAVWLIWVTLSYLYCLLLGREGLSESTQFWRLPEVSLRCLPFVLRNIPARWNVSNLGGNCYTIVLPLDSDELRTTDFCIE